MSSVIKSVSFDAIDALVLARFWAAALGSDVEEDATAEKGLVDSVTRAHFEQEALMALTRPAPPDVMPRYR